MSSEAIQVYLKEIFFDNPTVRRSMWGYVVSLATANIDDETQMWVSDSSFRTARRDGNPSNDDNVFSWDGMGRLIYSGPADGFDSLALQVYLIRDASKVRESGAFLEELFDDGGAGRDAYQQVKKLGDTVVASAAKALNAVEVSTQVLAVTGSVTKVVGRAMQNKGDRKLIHADGTITIDALSREETRYSDGVEWGVNKGDKGYFEIRVVRRSVGNADATPRLVRLPEEISSRMDLTI